MLKVSRKVAVLFRKRQGRFYKKTLNFSPKDGGDFLKSCPTFSQKIPKISGKDTVLSSSFRYKGKSIWGKALVENDKGGIGYISGTKVCTPGFMFCCLKQPFC